MENGVMSITHDDYPGLPAPERPISTGFLNVIYTDPIAEKIFATLLEVAETQSPGAARTALYELVEDEGLRITLERAFDERNRRENVRQDNQPVPPNIHEQTKVILDSGLADLMMARMPSDIPQSPPFDSEFWVETRRSERDEAEYTAVMVRWLEAHGSQQLGIFQRVGFRAEAGIPFGHSGHEPLSDEHIAVVASLSGWRFGPEGQ